MIRWALSKLIRPNQSQKQRKENKENKEKQYLSQYIALPYCLFTLLFFAMQGLVATMGALDLVFPDFPGPIKFEVGRAIHLNLSTYWPLLGCMGIVYYFFIQEAQTEIHSARLAWLQLFLYLITGFIAYFFLILGFLRGSEYQETTLASDLGLLLTLIIFVYNLARTYLKPKVPRTRATLLTMLVGSLSLLALYIPNIIKYVHPTVNEIVRFWIVHLWEEMSKELIVFGALAAFFLSINNSKRKKLEKALLYQTNLLVISATLATGHHYYWVGTPPIWLWIGGISSVTQMIAIFFMIYLVYQGLKDIFQTPLGFGTKLALVLILCSVFYHLTGAALMGLAIAIPQLNYYCHGTYLTSAHAHLAVFGALGMFILASCIYILTKEVNFTKLEITLSHWGILLINGGLLTMAGTLAIAGLLQTYLWRIAGMDFKETHALLRPYLILRALGGTMFAAGDFLFIWANISVLWLERLKLIKKFFVKS
jgi:nitric oxide reductase subunit B